MAPACFFYSVCNLECLYLQINPCWGFIIFNAPCMLFVMLLSIPCGFSVLTTPKSRAMLNLSNLYESYIISPKVNTDKAKALSFSTCTYSRLYAGLDVF